MGNHACCRSCRHCNPPLGGEPGWCQLRGLAIHPELAGELWCHHWTARAPRLPLEGDSHNRQLALTDLLKN